MVSKILISLILVFSFVIFSQSFAYAHDGVDDGHDNVQQVDQEPSKVTDAPNNTVNNEKFYIYFAIAAGVVFVGLVAFMIVMRRL